MKKKKSIVTILMLLLFMMLQADLVKELEEKILNISEAVSPNVVEINVELKEEIRGWDWGSSYDEISGCGLILNDENYILTNYHISDKDNIKSLKVKFNGSEKAVDAELVGTDEMNDLALLQVDEIPFEPSSLNWADIEKVKAGQFVIALGDPLGLEKTISFGMISKVQRDLLTYEVNPFIQSDIRINSGSSGGPLINMKGEIVGINNKLNDFAFSVPTDVVQESIEKMKKGDVLKPYFGLIIKEVTKDYREFFQNDSLSGVIFSEFAFNSPLRNKNLKAGDIIVAINDEEITKDLDKSVVYYRRLINECEIGEKNSLTIWRFGKKHEVNFKVIEEPDRMLQKGFDCDNWGFIVKEYTEKLKFNQEKYYSEPIKAGQMYIDSFTGKKSSRFLKRGMVIAGIVVDNDFIEISNLKDIEKIYEAHKDDEYIMFKVLSQNSVDFVLAKKIDRSLESLED